MAKLSLKHIYKIYDNGTKAVDDFNLEIGDNEFIVFVGPSGCGKSTTLRMIAGLEDITAGDFLIDGVLANQLEPKHRDMAMVFQNYALYPHMTVYDNMAFGLRIRHVPKNEIEKRVQEAARILDITDQLNKKPKEMSGGQKQRVALGRAIVRKPKVFLLDEPLSNLDAKLRSSMRSEITRLHNVLKTTFIYVTHDQVEAMTMGSRIVVMKKGVIQQVDTPMNLYDYPSNVFVAGFIGTPQMNFIDANIYQEEKGNLCIQFGSNTINIDRSALSNLDNQYCYKKTNVTLGIRPEHILLSEKKAQNSIEVTINQIEALGNEANLIVSAGDESQKITVRIFRDDSLKVGDKIYISFNIEKIKLFEKESTKTLLARVPSNFTYKAKVDGNTINILGSKVVLPEYLKKLVGDIKDLVVSIPLDAIIKGKDICVKTAQIKDENNSKMYIGEYKNSYIMLPDMEGFDSKCMKFSLDLSKCKFFDESLNKLIVDSIPFENKIPGKLIPCERKMFVLNKTLVTKEDVLTKIRFAKLENPKFAEKMNNISENEIKNITFTLEKKKYVVKNKRFKLFNYDVLGKQLIPDEASIIKIYSLLGKKFALHNINYTLDADKINVVRSGGICAVVKDNVDFGISKYILVNVLNNDLYVKTDKKFKVGEKIHIDFESFDLGITDVNFGVKLI